MSTFFTVRLKVSKANMLQSNFIISPTPVFAAVMAGHALDARLGGDLGIKGMGIVHHDCRPWVEHMPAGEKTPAATVLVQRRGAYLFDHIKDPQATPLLPMALADLDWSLILHAEHAPSEERVEDTLSSMRLAGGQINHCAVRQFQRLDDALAHVRTGYWIDDRSDLLKLRSIEKAEKPGREDDAKDGSPADVARSPAQSITLPDDPAERLLQLTAIEPFTLPANLGYSLLEAPRTRGGVRDLKGRQLEHAYGESLIGLIRLKSLRSARAEGAINTDRFWRYGWVDDEFVVTNNPAQALRKERLDRGNDSPLRAAA